MNPGVLFLPVFRASMTAYLLGLLVLAVADFWRLSAGIPSQFMGLSAAVIWFFVFSLHANRRRYVDRGTALALLPVILAVLAKVVTGLTVMVMGMFEEMRRFAADNGVDASDDEAFLAAMSEPGFMAAFEAHIEANEAAALEIAAAGSTPSFLAFWLVILAFAPWFAQLKRKGGRINMDQTTPSMFNPARLAPQPDPAPAPEPTEPEKVEDVAPVASEPTEDVETAPPEAEQSEPEQSETEHSAIEPSGDLEADSEATPEPAAPVSEVKDSEDDQTGMSEQAEPDDAAAATDEALAPSQDEADQLAPESPELVPEAAPEASPEASPETTAPEPRKPD